MATMSERRSRPEESVVETVPEDEPVSLERPGPAASPEELAASLEAGSVFCPECGAQNGASATICGGCGRVLDPLAQVQRSTEPARELRLVVLATVAGICLVAVLVAWLADLSMQLTVREVFRYDGERPVRVKVLASKADMAQVTSL